MAVVGSVAPEVLVVRVHFALHWLADEQGYGGSADRESEVCHLGHDWLQCAADGVVTEDPTALALLLSRVTSCRAMSQRDIDILYQVYRITARL